MMSFHVRRFLSAVLCVPFLTLTSGIMLLGHHDCDHAHQESHDCAICFTVKANSAAVVAEAPSLPTVFHAGERLAVTGAATPTLHDRHAPASPRGPPPALTTG
jgi:hypothetical protein